MCRRASLALFLLLGVVPFLSLWPDAVRLTSGQVIEGKIVEESESTIVIRTRNGDLSIPRKDVLEVENKGAERIVRLDVQRPNPVRAAVFSLIPFYSGLYLGDEPALGVPFALAGGVYGLRLLNTFARRVAYTEWHSASGREDLFTLAMVGAAARRAKDPAYSVDADPDRLLLVSYDLLRIYPVAGHRVGGRFYEKDELADYRRRLFQRYALSAGLGAGAAYAYFRYLGPGGVSGWFSNARTDSQPQFLAWYALPLGPKEWTAGAVFGF